LAYIGAEPLVGNYSKLDDISSGFNGSTTDFTLQVGSVNVTPPQETTMIISVGGLIQEPVTAYTVSGSTISFTSAPAAGAGFFGVLLGDSLSIGIPSDGTVTAAKFAASLLVTEAEGISSNDNDATIPTSAAVKDYVDTAVATEDTLAELNDTTITTPADADLLIYDTGTSMWRNQAVSGDVTIDDTGAVTAAATQNTITSIPNLATVGTIGTGTWNGTAIADAYVANDLTINGGSVDNSIIGGSTAAAGTFTTLTISGTTNITEVIEDGTVSATAATGTINYDLLTQSVLYYTSDASANWTVNIRGDGSTTLDSLLDVGDSASFVFMVTQGVTPYYPTAFQVDGSSVTPKWQGGSAPSAGNASSIDVYAYTVIKTAATPTYTVLGAQTQFA